MRDDVENGAMVEIPVLQSNRRVQVRERLGDFIALLLLETVEVDAAKNIVRM